MHSQSSKGPSQRQLRVGEQLKQIIAEAMQRGHFQHEVLLDAEHIVVSEVRVSPDLKNATAYVTTLGGKDLDVILPALNESAKIFQKEINRSSNLKFTPRVTFRTDKSFGEASRIEELLRDIHQNTNIDEDKD